MVSIMWTRRLSMALVRSKPWVPPMNRANSTTPHRMTRSACTRRVAPSRGKTITSPASSRATRNNPFPPPVTRASTPPEPPITVCNCSKIPSRMACQTWPRSRASAMLAMKRAASHNTRAMVSRIDRNRARTFSVISNTVYCTAEAQ